MKLHLSGLPFFITLVLASLSASASESHPLDVDPALCKPLSHPSIQDRQAQVDALKEVMVRGMTTLLPHDFSGDPSSIFNGNYDWHSSVHNHWALLSLARVTHDSALESKMLARLTPLALKKVHLNLTQNIPYNEMPYGQAWLLLLLRELRNPAHQLRGLSKEAQELRIDTEEHLIQYLESSPFPEMGNRFVGMHGSWTFAYMLLKQSEPSEKFSARMSRLETKFQTQLNALDRQSTPGPTDFMLLPAISSVIRNDRTYKIDPLAIPAQGPTDPYRAHSSGALLTSLWPYALQSSINNPSSCRVFTQSLNTFLDRTDLWKDNFEKVAHWVPQFAWFGILLEQGEL